MRCPQCDSELTQVGQFWICPNHSQVSPEKPFEPLRIFLSYGHDENEVLVRRIKADLERRRHDVWFDKTPEEEKGIRAGDDWRRAITDGILNSNRVLSFLSKHSTRDPGVCLDEIGIAIGAKGGNIKTILVESETEVKPPPTVGHIQWLDMHDWKTRHGVVQITKDQPATGDAAWEAWYQAQFTEIVRVVESEESRRFAGEIKDLQDYLKPISSDSRVGTLLRKGFVGRKWLFKAIEEWRNAPDRTSRLFWITGEPGVGKSAFAAQLTHSPKGNVIAAEFCQWNNADHRNAHRVIRSLAFQLACRLPDYRRLLLTLPEIAVLDRKDSETLFDYLLTNPLRSVIDGGRERYLIVIDALDEAGKGDHNALVDMLADHAPSLPKWIGIVVTSRPDEHVTGPLQGLEGLRPVVLGKATEDNRGDICEYLQQKLASKLQGRADTERLFEQILKKSEGVFLYVEHFCEDVLRGDLSLDRPEQFPQGLSGIFRRFFKRQFPNLKKFRKDVRPALRAILAAREPLPVEILQHLFNWQDEEVQDFIYALGSLFPVTTEAGTEVIKPYHLSLADWLADNAKAGRYFVSTAEGQRLLVDYYMSHWQTDTYSLNEVVQYLIHARRADELVALLFNNTYQEIRASAIPSQTNAAPRLVRRMLDLRTSLNQSCLSQLIRDFEAAETCAHGRLGVAGCVLRISPELNSLFTAACEAAQRWNTLGIGSRVCAAFSLRLLGLLQSSDVGEAIHALREYASRGENSQCLTLARERVKQAIVELASRQLFDSREDALRAASAGLLLQPTLMVKFIIEASKHEECEDVYSRYDVMGGHLSGVGETRALDVSRTIAGLIHDLSTSKGEEALSVIASSEQRRF